MKLRQHRRRTIARMRWRTEHLWWGWKLIDLDPAIQGIGTGDGSFTFEKLTPNTKFSVEVIRWDDDGKTTEIVEFDQTPTLEIGLRHEA